MVAQKGIRIIKDAANSIRGFAAMPHAGRGYALSENRSIHMAGALAAERLAEAGQSFEELIRTCMSARGIHVTVYDLPNAVPVRAESTLF